MARRVLKLLTTTTEVYDRLGGNAGVMKITGVSSPSQAANWRGAGTFPSNTYCAMTDALANLGYRAPRSLWRMREPRRASSPRSDSRPAARASA